MANNITHPYNDVSSCEADDNDIDLQNSLINLVNEARTNYNITTYTIGFGTATVNSTFLQKMANAGGGKYYDIGDTSTAEDVYTTIAQQVIQLDVAENVSVIDVIGNKIDPFNFNYSASNVNGSNMSMNTTRGLWFDNNTQQWIVNWTFDPARVNYNDQINLTFDVTIEPCVNVTVLYPNATTPSFKCGEDVDIKVKVTNCGAGTLYGNVTVMDILVPINITPDGGTPTTFHTYIPSLEPGESAIADYNYSISEPCACEYDIFADVPADVKVLINKKLTVNYVHAPTGLVMEPIIANTTTPIYSGTRDDGIGDFSINYAPNIIVNKFADKDYAGIGEIINYTIIINNTGDVNLTNVTIIDTIPYGFEVVNFSDNVNKNSYSNNVLNLTLNYELENWAIVWVTVKVNSSANGTLCNEVYVEGYGRCTGWVNDSDNTSCVMAVHPDINVTKTANVSSAVYGSSVLWTINVTNTGDVPVNVTFNDSLDECNLSSIHNLGVGETENVTCVSIAGCDNMANIVYANATQGYVVGDVVKSANASVASIDATDISISKEASTDNASYGDNVTFTIIVTN
ncbi:MAG: hypothetical protein CVT90_02745, partial [Candidatus Altiarchaeales archaeon HGW-Altiarchaeales-3]